MKSALLLTAALLAASTAFAHEYKAGAIAIAHPHARATAPGQPAGAAYLGLNNTGATADKLLRASSPAATSVEVHTMSMEGNVMKMREVGSIELPPGANIAMKPGDGYHLMLMGLKNPLKLGDKIPMTLVSEKAGSVEVTVNVEELKKKDGEMPMQHKH